MTTPNSPLDPPQVKDRSRFPPGILPRNTQAWVIGLIALVMVLVIALTGERSPKKGSESSPATPSATPADQNRIEELRRRIEEQARRLAEERARVALTKQMAGLDATTDAPMPGPGWSTGRPPAGVGHYGSAREFTPVPPPEKTWAEQDLEKRRYQSLYASNMAVSHREEFERAGNRPAQSDATPPADKSKETRAEPGPAAKTYRISEGTVIESTLVNRLDGEFSGPVICLVTTDVYSRDRQHVLIPSGTRVLGAVKKVDATGQRRLAIAFHRMILPNQRSVSLINSQGLNQLGETGLRDRVNNHYLQIFGVSLAIGAIAGFSQANTRYGLDASAADVYRQSAGASVAQSSLHILDRFLNALPTHTILEGHRIKVYLTGDLDLPAYNDEHNPQEAP